MNLSFRKSLLAFSLCLCVVPLSIHAQPAGVKSPHGRSNYIQVSAPLAQEIVLNIAGPPTKSRH